ncbi:MAG: 2-oxo-4-hydroxy-4-carboxy-5-ureidoimidazoline decarboxylase [Gammaproteobacteria bacterium]|nr:2-oxo-4-hydroxy-4-carboxy-5-ureidoimidazoline decarboxylase [Gammaproteobacteria bacterium]
MTDTISLSTINQLTAAQFIDILGGIYEHSSWVAEQVYQQRPFDSLQKLQIAMANVVRASSHTQRLTLIRNHPQLAGKEASQGTLTTDSKNEQRGAGLDQCSSEELKTIQTLNKQYLQVFEFPFVIAVKGLDRHQIIAAMQLRLHNTQQIEFDTSIDEICKIAEIRLRALISG